MHRVDLDFLRYKSVRCHANVGIVAPTDYVDEYVRICVSIVVECLKQFVQGVNAIFSSEYLRRLNVNDIRRWLKLCELRGFRYRKYRLYALRMEKSSRCRERSIYAR